MKEFYESMNNLLDKSEDFVMATILKKSGSAPREEGTKMLIRKDYSIDGTIGGGLLEAMTIKLSSRAFKSEEFIIENLNLAQNEVIPLGKQCGGDIEILLEYMDCKDIQLVDIYRKFIDLKRNNTNFVVITKISENQNRITGSDKWICTETGLFGTEDDEVQGIIRKIRENFHEIKINRLNLEDERYLIEPFFNHESAYIIGAGHIAQKIAFLTKMLGFYTVVIDDRKEFANTERFNSADEIIVIPSFNQLHNYVKINNKSYIIIVTRGHSYDKEVLGQVLAVDAKYVGMIGNKNKRLQIYGELLKDGFTYGDLERVYSPIGLNIYAQTPEEIAVSVVAEIVKVKRGPQYEKH